MECVLSGICGMGEYVCAVCVWVGIYVEGSCCIWGMCVWVRVYVDCVFVNVYVKEVWYI